MQGFTPIELVIVVACLMILAALVLPTYSRSNPTRAQRISCFNNLKQVGLAQRTWSLDNQDHYPMSEDVTNGGTFQFVGAGTPFRHYQVMSNELSTPKILVCPADIARTPATTFTLAVATGSAQIPFNNNSNVSYFVGVDADPNFPNAFLSGDRWLGSGGLQFRPSLQILQTNSAIEWVNSAHPKGMGNLGLADGSVQQLSSKDLKAALRATRLSTNRLEIP